MSSIHRREGDLALEGIWHELGHVSDRPEGITRRVLPALSTHLESEHAGAYALDPMDAEVSLDELHVHGTAFLAWKPVLEDVGRSRPGGLTLASWIREVCVGIHRYDPVCPAPEQRNRVIAAPASWVASAAETRPTAYELVARYPELMRTINRFHVLRVLICEGPVFLSFIGAARDRPYTPAEVRRFQRLVPLLRERVSLDVRLGVAGAGAAALSTALERLDAPAFVFGRGGALVHANSAGRALRDAARLEVAALLRRFAQLTPPVSDRGWTVTRLAAPGLPPHWLAVQRASPADPRPRAAALAARHGLSQRQVEVLLHVASGRSNKDIAGALGCSEGMVEAHLTSLFERTGCSGRSALAARVWAER